MTSLSISDINIETLESVRSRGEGRFDWRMISLFALCIFGAAISRLCYIVRPFDSDGSMFIYMGRLISEGGRFCHELVDNKFPSVGLLTSVPWKFFGADWTSWVLLGGAMSAITCAMLMRMAGRAFGEYAKIPALLCALVYFNFNFAVFGGFQLETVQAFFTVLCAGAALEWLREGDWKDALLVGLAGGCAAMCKPTGLAPVVALVIAAIFNRRETAERAAALLGMIIGLAAPVGVVLTYLIQTDTLRDMPELMKQISRYATSSSWDPSDWIKPLTILVLGGFPIFVRGVIFRKDWIETEKTSGPKSAAAYVIVWLILETVGIAAQRRMYAYHFLVMVPPIVLLFAMIPRQVRAVSLAAALLPMAFFSISGAALVFEICYTGEPMHPTSAYMASHTKPTDAVWKDDAAQLWLETGRRPATRFPMTFLFANYDKAASDYLPLILRDFDHTRPKYLVLPRERDRWVAHQCKYILELSRFPARKANFENAWQQIFDYVDRNYVYEAHVGQDAIYRRAGVESQHADALD